MTRTRHVGWGWRRMGFVLVMSLAACGQMPAEEEVMFATVAQAQAQEPGPEPADGQYMLSDRMIAVILLASNQAEVALSQAALPRVTDPSARAFAEQMVADHTAAVQRLEALMQRLGIMTDRMLLDELTRLMTEKHMKHLATLQGADFDLAFMDMQVGLHAHLASMSDVLLSPRVQNPELAQELRLERTEVQEHLARAVEIQGSLVAGRP